MKLSYKRLTLNVPIALVRCLKRRMRYVRAAGGIVADDSGRLLLILRNGRWDLPKGKVEPGETLLQGAMLHDYFLYDWHENHHDENGWHGFSHAETALRNAREDFDIDPQVAHIIHSHMWPLNITRIPRTREAWIVCIADKWVSGRETLFHRSKSDHKQDRSE